MSLLAASGLLSWLGAAVAAPPPSPVLEYALRLDATNLDVADVTIRLRGAPPSLHLAMKVHAEYDARYWRFVEGIHVEGTDDDRTAAVEREEDTLWRVTLPGGHGEVRYRIRIQPPPAGLRRAWLSHVRTDGAILNNPDIFLYLPEFASTPATVDLDVPRDWQVATALPSRGASTRRSAPDAATLLDSPILLGALRTWSFEERGTVFHVVYWPLPGAAPFDTAAFVDGLRRLTKAAIDVFGRAPSREYTFLIQDGASDALEHAASVTIGVPSDRLARDPRASIVEIAHELFHTWNLVAIRPAGYNDLSFRAPARTSLLWLGEGVTLHYADVLPRRAGLAGPTPTRLDHLGSLLERYYGSPAILRVSPERASLAFGDSYVANSDATGGYYLQGELLGEVLDARVRDATHERRGLDDVMRKLFDRSRAAGGGGITAHDVERAVSSTCSCSMAEFFAGQVRGSGPIDVTPALQRLGLRLALDTGPATDANGQSAPDLRLGADFSAPSGVARFVISNPATAWAAAGLRTGDDLVALNGVPVRSHAELQAALRLLRVGDCAAVDIRRGGESMRVDVPVTGYSRTRVRFEDVEGITPGMAARRQEWLAGR